MAACRQPPMQPSKLWVCSLLDAINLALFIARGSVRRDPFTLQPVEAELFSDALYPRSVWIW